MVLGRKLLPLMLLVAALGAIVYGSAYRAVPVLVEEEVEVEKEVVPPRPPAPPFMQGGPGANGPGGARPPFMPPPPPLRPQKVKVKELQTSVQPRPERQVLREVTVGGLERLADGQIRLVYRMGQEGPALCPT